jgi:hypothetical protein
MTAVILKNNAEGDGPILPPTKEDGTGYGYCLYFNNDAEVAFADSPDELLDALIPGYSADVDNQDFLRIRLAQNAAAQTQAEILFGVDPSTVDETTWATLTSPRNVSQPRADWWTSAIPLVVVETGYEPYTSVPRPASAIADGLADAPNLWFLRPGEEEDFLVSLHEVGYVRLMRNTFDD